jgi:hypothetical protein
MSTTPSINPQHAPSAPNELSNSLHDILSWALDHLITSGKPETIKSWFNSETDRWDRYMAEANNNPAAAWQAARNELGKDMTKALVIAFPLLNQDAQHRLVTKLAQRQQQQQHQADEKMATTH